MDINQKLAKQYEKYGSFGEVSAVTDGLFMVAEGNAGIRTRWSQLGPDERQALRGLLTKIGRLLSPGLSTHPAKLYEDVIGYAMLGRDCVMGCGTPQTDMFQQEEPMTFREYREYSGFEPVYPDKNKYKYPVNKYDDANDRGGSWATKPVHLGWPDDADAKLPLRGRSICDDS